MTTRPRSPGLPTTSTPPTQITARSADAPASTAPPKRPRRITVPWVRRAAGRDEPLVMVTAYDFPQARAADAADVDIVLVGDSLAMVVLGHDDTLSLTVEEMLHHVKAVRRGMDRALLVADMPFGSFHLGPNEAIRNALRLVKEGGAQAVKIEGARSDVVQALSAAEIPVMAHLGLTPQSVHQLGGFKVQGRGEAARARLLEASLEMQEAGAFALVLECVPSELAAEISASLSIPTIGIGAGLGCAGQVLVYHDLLGLEERIAPRFVRRYAQLGTLAREGIARYADDVRQRRFPSGAESYVDPSTAASTTAASNQTIEKLYG